MGVNLYIMVLTGIINKFKYQRLIAEICYHEILKCDYAEQLVLKDLSVYRQSNMVPEDDIVDMTVCCN